MASPLLIAKNEKTSLELLPALANRHGLVTGATGTGKSVTLQTMAQRFSKTVKYWLRVALQIPLLTR